MAMTLFILEDGSDAVLFQINFSAPGELLIVIDINNNQIVEP
jgi:hypothetical protein